MTSPAAAPLAFADLLSADAVARLADRMTRQADSVRRPESRAAILAEVEALRAHVERRRANSEIPNENITAASAAAKEPSP
jgi:hypothetical protein